MKVSEWLNIKFLDWQRSAGKRKTIAEFASFLGVTQASLSDWLRGKYDPKGKNLGKIANKLGYEIYDILGIPRPLPMDLDDQVNELVRSAMQLPPDVQAHVIAVFREMLPILVRLPVMDDDQVLRMMVDLLSKRIPDGEHAARLASLASGIPRTVIPLGIGFSFARTPENKQRFQKAGMAAAKKIEELGLLEDTDEGQSVILDVFASYGFHPVDSGNPGLAQNKNN